MLKKLSYQYGSCSESQPKENDSEINTLSHALNPVKKSINHSVDYHQQKKKPMNSFVVRKQKKKKLSKKKNDDDDDRSFLLLQSLFGGGKQNKIRKKTPKKQKGSTIMCVKTKEEKKLLQNTLNNSLKIITFDSNSISPETMVLPRRISINVNPRLKTREEKHFIEMLDTFTVESSLYRGYKEYCKHIEQEEHVISINNIEFMKKSHKKDIFQPIIMTFQSSHEKIEETMKKQGKKSLIYKKMNSHFKNSFTELSFDDLGSNNGSPEVKMKENKILVYLQELTNRLKISKPIEVRAIFQYRIVYVDCKSPKILRFWKSIFDFTSQKYEKSYGVKLFLQPLERSRNNMQNVLNSSSISSLGKKEVKPLLGDQNFLLLGCSNLYYQSNIYKKTLLDLYFIDEYKNIPIVWSASMVHQKLLMTLGSKAIGSVSYIQTYQLQLDEFTSLDWGENSKLRHYSIFCDKKNEKDRYFKENGHNYLLYVKFSFTRNVLELLKKKKEDDTTLEKKEEHELMNYFVELCRQTSKIINRMIKEEYLPKNHKFTIIKIQNIVVLKKYLNIVLEYGTKYILND